MTTLAVAVQQGRRRHRRLDAAGQTQDVLSVAVSPGFRGALRARSDHVAQQPFRRGARFVGHLDTAQHPRQFFLALPAVE